MNLAIPPMRLALIRDGADGITDTLNIMAALVRQYKKNPAIRTLAVQLARSGSPGLSKNWGGQIVAIFNWVRTNVAYVQDVTEIETLQTPLATIDQGAGDCDDMVTLLAALLEAVGLHTRFVAIGFVAPDEYEHVFLQVEFPDGRRWVSLDPTEREQPGWSPTDRLSPAAIMIKDNATEKSLLL